MTSIALPFVRLLAGMALRAANRVPDNAHAGFNGFWSAWEFRCRSRPCPSGGGCCRRLEGTASPIHRNAAR